MTKNKMREEMNRIDQLIVISPVIGGLGSVEVGDSNGNGFVVHGERAHAAVVHRRRLEVIPDNEDRNVFLRWIGLTVQIKSLSRYKNKREILSVACGI